MLIWTAPLTLCVSHLIQRSTVKWRCVIRSRISSRPICMAKLRVTTKKLIKLWVLLMASTSIHAWRLRACPCIKSTASTRLRRTSWRFITSPCLKLLTCAATSSDLLLFCIYQFTKASQIKPDARLRGILCRLAPLMIGLLPLLQSTLTEFMITSDYEPRDKENRHQECTLTDFIWQRKRSISINSSLIVTLNTNFLFKYPLFLID